MPSSTERPALVPDQIITFETEGSRNIQGRFSDQSLHTWTVKVSETAIRKFRSKQNVGLFFATADAIYSGSTTLLDVMPSSRKLILQIPENLRSRPRRKHPRKNCHLPTALIITAGAAADSAGHNEFVGRRNNRIMNISKGGALLAASTPLPMGIDEILLLVSLDLDDPYSELNQISVSAKIIRGHIETGDKVYPHGYGIAFNPMFPAFKHALDYFVEVILDDDSSVI